jgi:hypothetical protein
MQDSLGCEQRGVEIYHACLIHQDRSNNPVHEEGTIRYYLDFNFENSRQRKNKKTE